MDEHHMSPSRLVHILDGFISEQEFAQQRGVSLRTCQRDRARRTAPPYVVIGRQTFYRLEAAREWLIGREVRTTLGRGEKRRR